MEESRPPGRPRGRRQKGKYDPLRAALLLLTDEEVMQATGVTKVKVRGWRYHPTARMTHPQRLQLIRAVRRKAIRLSLLASEMEDNFNPIPEEETA